MTNELREVADVMKLAAQQAREQYKKLGAWSCEAHVGRAVYEALRKLDAA